MKFKIIKFLLVSVLIGIILFSICPKVFATNGNEMSISSKEGIGNTVEIISGSTNSIRSESVADVVSYLLGQGIIVNSITNHKGASVELTSTALIGTGYVLDTNNGNYSVIVYGDANGDGEADAGDMKLIIDNFLGINQASPIAKIAVDLYQDGDLDAADLKQVLDSFLGNLTGSILKTTSASNPTPTPDASVTPTPDVSPTPVEVNSQIKIGNQTVTLTRDNAPEYYGQVVTNYSATNSATWRLFYIDFDGDFGDAGTIYLKADQILQTELNIVDSVNSTDALAKMKQINPDWAQNDGYVDENNEKGVLWLCDEKKWNDYKNNEKANWAIGAPSLEMYVKSYNEYHSKKGTSGYEQLKCKWFDKTNIERLKGYMYAVGLDDDNYVYNGNNNLKADENNMYVNSDEYWWLASTSAQKNYSVYYVDGGSFGLYSGSYDRFLWASPLVSLKAGVIPEISDSTTTPEVTGPQIKVGNQTITLTPDNAPEYYGKVVTNYNQADATYRLFYVDFDGDFGPEGTIYLKADRENVISLNTDLIEVVDSVDALEKMRSLNPDWAQKDGIADNDNEQGVLWLCDKENATWKEFYDEEKANWAIGAPSVEMYVKSYNAYHSKKGTRGYQKLNCKWFSAIAGGYEYALGASVDDSNYGYRTTKNTIKADENSMYTLSWQYIWLASPAADGEDRVCCVRSVEGKDFFIGANGCSGTAADAPLVSLKSDFIPEFEN